MDGWTDRLIHVNTGLYWRRTTGSAVFHCVLACLGTKHHLRGAKQPAQDPGRGQQLGFVLSPIACVVCRPLLSPLVALFVPGALRSTAGDGGPQSHGGHQR